MKCPSYFPILIRDVLLVVASFLGGYYFTSLFHQPTSLVGGMWAVISAIVVIESSHPDTLASAGQRILGTLVGSVVSGTYLVLFPFSVFGYAAAIGFGMFICYLFKIEKAIKLTAITISVVLIVATIDESLHPYVNAGLRLVESSIGSGVAVVAAFLSYNFLSRKGKQITDKKA